MVEVVDAMVVTLGLDTTQYDAAQKRAADSLDKTKQQAASTAKEMQSRGGQAAEFFTKVRNEALSLAAVLIGGRGLEALTRDTVTNLAGLGRAANDIGLSVPKVAALRNMIEASGGNAAAATASFTNLAMAIQRAVSGQGITGGLQTFLSRIGASPSDPIDVIYSKFNVWAQGRKATDVHVLGEMGGLDVGTIREALKPIAEFQKDMAEAVKRGLPTKEMTDNMRALESAFTKTTQAVQTLTNEGLNKLAPVLTRILDAITNFIVAHPTIASAAGVAATTAGAAGFGAWALRLLRGGGAAGAAAGVGVGGVLGWLGAALGLGYLGFGVGGTNEGEQIPGGRKGQPLPPAPDTAGRDRQAYDFFRAKGWTPAQSAALAGSIKGESGFNETTRGDNGQAVGIGQWHPDRVQKILAGTGIDVRTAPYAQQLEAMHWELNNTESAAGDKLRSSTSVFDASRSLVYDYERPKNKVSDTLLRSVAAASYLQRFQDAGGAEAVSSSDWVRNLHVFGAAGATSSTRNSNQTTIGQIVVNTRATDASGIARALGDQLRDNGLYVAQANSGIN